MSLLNGLAAMGESVAKTAGMMSLEAMRSSLEEDRARLAREFAEGAASRGRKEAHGLAMEQQRSEQDFKRPAQDASIEASKAQADQSRTATGIATAKEGRLQAGIKTAQGGGRAGTAGEDYQRKFIESVRPFAEEAAKKTGVDPRVIIAQAALESDWGRAAPGNNYLGVKSHGQPGGQTLDTTEAGPDGRPVKTKDSFRTYNTPAESFKDYAAFISANSRYAELRSAKDLDSQIAALGKSGYATDPQYAQKVGSIARSIGEGGAPGGAPGAGLPPDAQRDYDALVAAGDLDKAAELRMRYTAERKTKDQWVPLNEEAGKRLLGAGFDPNKSYQMNTANGEIKPIGGAMVNIDQKGESVALKTQIEAAAKTHGELQEAAKTARTGLAQVERLNDLMNQLSTGKFSATALEVKRIAQSFGIDLGEKEIGVAEAADALSKQLALQMRNPAGGAGMPGAMSDADREFLMRTIPTLGTTPEGRAAIVETARTLFQRTLEEAKIANDYMRSREFATDPSGLYARLQQHADANPMFARQPMEAESDASGFGAGGGPRGAAGTARPADEAAYRALPSGTIYLHPDGVMRRKP